MEETDEFYTSQCLVGQAGNLFPPQVDCLVWISCLQPSVVETAQTAQVQGISIVAKSCLFSKPTQLWQLFSTTRTARNAHAAHVCHFCSLSPLLLHNKPVSASSFQLFCQRAQTLCAMALTMDRAGCFCSS